MAECSQKFKDMLAGYKSDVHHECLLIDDFLADTDPILQYVAELEVERDGLRARLDSALADAAAAWRRHDNANKLQLALQMENAELRKEYLYG